MTAIQGDADRYLASPPEGTRLFLIHGSDPGAITERARTVERVALQRGGSDRVHRFGSDLIAEIPGLISDEVRSASLFGGEPVVSVRVLDGRHNVMGAVQDVLDRPPDAAWLIIEAGELKKDSALRRAFEASRHAASVATYHAEGPQLAAMIHAASESAGILIEPAAMDLLAGILGGDRLASRSELEKLFLYVGDSGTVSLADVEAVAGNTAELNTDAILDSALLGDHEGLETGMDRLRAEGGSAAALGGQMLRHLVQLSAMRAAMDAGQGAASAMESARPPVFARRRAAVENELKRWTSPALAEARRLVADAVALTRYQSALEMAAVSEALHQLALQARRLRAAPRA